MHSLHFVVLLEKVGDREGGGVVLAHPKAEGLHSTDEEIGAVRIQVAAKHALKRLHPIAQLARAGHDTR